MARRQLRPPLLRHFRFVKRHRARKSYELPPHARQAVQRALTAHQVAKAKTVAKKLALSVKAKAHIVGSGAS
ncbi:hypothetical protein CIC12_21985 [Burkholderia sp. SG-MS1]|nr:hypothetical protein [Paraburkholderia sp. SG-MS1]